MAKPIYVGRAPRCGLPAKESRPSMSPERAAAEEKDPVCRNFSTDTTLAVSRSESQTGEIGREELPQANSTVSAYGAQNLRSSTSETSLSQTPQQQGRSIHEAATVYTGSRSSGRSNKGLKDGVGACGSETNTGVCSPNPLEKSSKHKRLKQMKSEGDDSWDFTPTVKYSPVQKTSAPTSRDGIRPQMETIESGESNQSDLDLSPAVSRTGRSGLSLSLKKSIRRSLRRFQEPGSVQQILSQTIAGSWPGDGRADLDAENRECLMSEVSQGEAVSGQADSQHHTNTSRHAVELPESSGNRRQASHDVLDEPETTAVSTNPSDSDAEVPDSQVRFSLGEHNSASRKAEVSKESPLGSPPKPKTSKTRGPHGDGDDSDEDLDIGVENSESSTAIVGSASEPEKTRLLKKRPGSISRSLRASFRKSMRIF